MPAACRAGAGCVVGAGFPAFRGATFGGVAGFAALAATTLVTGAALCVAGFAAFFAGGAFFIGLAATFFTACFAAAGFAAGRAAGFLATGLAATFFTTGFLAAGLRGSAFLAAACFAAGLCATAFVAAFRGRDSTGFDLPGAMARDRTGVFPLTVLAEVELRVVFAIFLHRFLPWRPGVIAHVCYPSKPAFGILAGIPEACRDIDLSVLTRPLLFLLRQYKRWLSPLLGKRCRFYPSCSDYARIAIARFGPLRGCLLTAWRLLRCQPLCAGGDDPVPERFAFPRWRGAHGSHRH